MPPLEPLLVGTYCGPRVFVAVVVERPPMLSPLPQEGSTPMALLKALRVPEPTSRVATT